jgi:hypothetical protein
MIKCGLKGTATIRAGHYATHDKTRFMPGTQWPVSINRIGKPHGTHVTDRYTQLGDGIRLMDGIRETATIRARHYATDGTVDVWIQYFAGKVGPR